MKRLSNKALASLAIAPWALVFVLGVFESILGYGDHETILPAAVEVMISVVGLIITIIALVRLYNMPDPAEESKQAVPHVDGTLSE